MSAYRFTGRIASFFRATGNSWATARVVADTVGTRSSVLQGELNTLLDWGHVERRKEQGPYEYRWNPDTLLEPAKGREKEGRDVPHV